jgi:hypothetical protein
VRVCTRALEFVSERAKGSEGEREGKVVYVSIVQVFFLNSSTSGGGPREDVIS